MSRKTMLTLFALAVLGAALGSPFVHADGGPFPRRVPWNAQREQTLINEPSQKAAIFYRNGREQLIISPSFEGPPGGFAWVVPVPKRPQVKILTGALFHELARIVAPAPPVYPSRSPGAAIEKAAPRPPVVVLERRTVGAYDVSVLSATDGGALARWLNQNGYLTPPPARRPLAEYVREHWTFVACRVKAPANARGLQSGTLAPLSLTFPAEKIVYPMRLSAINPRPFHLLLYLLRPAPAGDALPETWPGLRPLDLSAASVSPGNALGSYPTLAGFDAKTLTIRWTETIVTPQDCVRDYVWNLPRR